MRTDEPKVMIAAHTNSGNVFRASGFEAGEGAYVFEVEWFSAPSAADLEYFDTASDIAIERISGSVDRVTASGFSHMRNAAVN